MHVLSIVSLSLAAFTSLAASVPTPPIPRDAHVGVKARGEYWAGDPKRDVEKRGEYWAGDPKRDVEKRGIRRDGTLEPNCAQTSRGIFCTYTDDEVADYNSKNNIDESNGLSNYCGKTPEGTVCAYYIV